MRHKLIVPTPNFRQNYPDTGYTDTFCHFTTGAAGAGGAAPAVWSTLMAPNARTAVPINGLTPGTTYAVQVRAYGQLGYTAYSDSVTRMVI